MDRHERPSGLQLGSDGVKEVVAENLRQRGVHDNLVYNRNLRWGVGRR
jgi:hypothetical protein